MTLVPLVPILVVLALGTGIVLAVRRGLASEPEAPRGHLAGIAGWLILPAIGLILGPIAEAVSLAEIASILPLATPGTVIHTFILATQIGTVALTVFSIVAAVSFFRRKRRAPSLYIGLIVATWAFAVGATWAALALTGDAGAFDEMGGPIIVGLVQAIIWIPYFRRSKRVAATFTR